MSGIVGGIGLVPMAGAWTAAASGREVVADFGAAGLMATETAPEQSPALHADLFQEPSVLLAAARRSLGRHGSPKGPGGLNGSGNGGRGGLPFFHLTRVYFQPGRDLNSGGVFFDQKLLEAAYRCLGRVITDAVLVVGRPLVYHQAMRTYLTRLAGVTSPDQRFAELSGDTQGRVIDTVFGQPAGRGFPVARLSEGHGSGQYSIRQYHFYQKEGPPITVAYRNRRPEDFVPCRLDNLHPELREVLLDLRRTMERLDRQDLRALVNDLYDTAFSRTNSENRLTFAQGSALLLETQNPGRYPPAFFDALWRLIYHVRLAVRLPRGEKPVLVEDAYQRLWCYLEPAVSEAS